MTRVHAVDGTYELFRNYFGAPEAKAPDGREVGATRGMLRTLASLIKQPDVTHVGVAFVLRLSFSHTQTLFAVLVKCLRLKDQGKLGSNLRVRLRVFSALNAF